MMNMHVWPYFVLENTVWFSDSLAGGLYTYDYECGKVCCKIRADKLFRCDIYEIATITCWKSLVFIFSKELKGPHIVYDSLKEEIKRLNGIENDNQDVVIHQANVIDEILYLIPTEIKGYIYAINLSSWNETDDRIDVFFQKVGKDITMKTWLPKSNGKLLYISEYAGKRVVCVENSKLEIIDLDIPFELCTIDVFREELWVAPLYGEYIFCLTKEGKIRKKIKIPSGCVEGGKSDIWEIIAKKDFVFFLHWTQPIIDIYCRKNKKTIQIDGKKFELPCEGEPSDRQYFLPYVMNDNTIRFLPSRCSMLEIDLSNSIVCQKDFGFPTQISDEEWINWCEIVRKYRKKTLLCEGNGEGIELFVRDIFEELFMWKSAYNRGINIGRFIYQYISKR